MKRYICLLALFAFALSSCGGGGAVTTVAASKGIGADSMEAKLLKAKAVDVRIMADPYMSEEDTKALQQSMMNMKPDTMEASLERGKKLYHDPTIGNGNAGQSCASCHEGGGSIGGAATTEVIKPGGFVFRPKLSIPTLKGAAVSFPKPRGPRRGFVVNLIGMNSMCIAAFNKGQWMDANSQGAVDLANYIAMFSKGKKWKPGAKKILPGGPVAGAM